MQCTRPALITSYCYFRFSAFAELFSETVRRGLKGLQTQNPGLYYYHASLYAIQRKKTANTMSVDSKNPQLLSSLPQINYYGQRPWRKSLTGVCLYVCMYVCTHVCIILEPNLDLYIRKYICMRTVSSTVYYICLILQFLSCTCARRLYVVSIMYIYYL